MNIMLGFVSLCELKKTISGTFFKYGEYKPTTDCQTHDSFAFLFHTCPYMHTNTVCMLAYMSVRNFQQKNVICSK